MSVEQLGVLTTTRFDASRLINRDDNTLEAGLNLAVKPKPVSAEVKNNLEHSKSTNSVVNKSSTEKTTPLPSINTIPNVLNIDFNKLAKQESNSKIKAMHEYFSNVVPTNKNQYTGMFQGYNLIMITAEGFSPYAVNKEVTPTLYKLTHEGFVFNNFYTPLWWASTSDGEYVACTGLIPKSGVTSFYLSGSNSMPFALGNQFKSLGYDTNAYHNHTYTYYKRHISHPNMGYDYKGVGNGLNITERWPESDVEMMEVTIPEYIDQKTFHTYYMTVSGHMNYTFMGNSMSTKNKAVVDGLPYSMEAKAYLACNVELDRALKKLIEELEDKGIADKTVIALSADHYPYGLEKDKIDELAGHEVETNFELYKNHFILWTESMTKPIQVDKVCSSLDIMPTLCNLFGLPYDSRLFMGSDIFSTADPLVIFSNRSFITDKVMYNSKTKKVSYLTDAKLPDNYIKTMNQIINNKFVISESILNEDYYGYLLLDE
jgi:phosphoglycerol transferase MdoB-like AlkP superfamily enzyme